MGSRFILYSFCFIKFAFERIANVEKENFWQQLDARIAKYDLLCHPFYQAWSQGRLTREDLRAYAAEYFHHVAAFPEHGCCA